MNILFVCTGNTCRSPMAQALLEHKRIDVNVKSAGIFAFDGQTASIGAIETLNKDGIDISSHRANMVNRYLLEDADLILTMGISHKEALLSKYDFIKGKVYTLKEYAYGIQEDIIDPFGGDIKVYDNTKEEIDKALDEVLKKGGFTYENRNS